MYYKKYESERLYLSPMNVDDYQTFTKWMNDETLASGLGNFKNNFNELNEKEFLEKICKDGWHNYAIIRKEDNKLIGTYGLEVKSEVSRRFHVGGCIGEIDERGKGYGTECLNLITKYAFEVLNAETLFSGIYAFNHASIKSAEKAGYKIAGTYRNAYFYNGRYHDEICVEIIRDDYLKKKQKENLN